MNRGFGFGFNIDGPRSKAAIYTRVSTLNQAEKGYGLDSQLRICNGTCQMKNYEITKVYTDHGISGTTQATNRPGFGELLEDAKKGAFEVLVFFAFDRLARDIRVFLNIVDILRKYGIKIVSCKENIDTTTDSGEFMMNIYASVSHLELKTIKTRLAMGREQKRLESGYIGGSLPYGYSKVDGEIEANDFHSQVVNYIYNVYHKDKFSLRKIARTLTENNVSTPKGGKQWDAKSISIILDNKEKYEGGVINRNVNNIRWPVILTEKFPSRK